MLMFFNNLRALASDERGVTAMEYGLIAGLVAVVIIGSVTTLGTTPEYDVRHCRRCFAVIPLDRVKDRAIARP